MVGAVRSHTATAPAGPVQVGDEGVLPAVHVWAAETLHKATQTRQDKAPFPPPSGPNPRALPLALGPNSLHAFVGAPTWATPSLILRLCPLVPVPGGTNLQPGRWPREAKRSSCTHSPWEQMTSQTQPRTCSERWVFSLHGVCSGVAVAAFGS